MKVKVVSDSIVALECDVLPSNPPPQIQWNDDFGLVENTTTNKVYFTDGGRFLIIVELNEMRLQSQYYCSLRNIITGDTINSSTKFVLTSGLMNGIIVEYTKVRNLVGIPGMTLSFGYAAGYNTSNPNGNNGVVLDCTAPRIIFHQMIYLISFRVPQLVGNNTEITVHCVRNTGDGALERISFTLTIASKYY